MMSNEIGPEEWTGRRAHVISCLTDKVTQKFYTELGVANFRLNHMGHNVKDGPLNQAEPTLPAAVEQGEVAPQGPVEGQLTPVLEELSIPISGLTVDVVFPNDDKTPIFRVLGFKDDGTKAFLLNVQPEKSEQLKSLLEKRQFVDKKTGQKIRYAWTQHVVEMSGAAKEALWPRQPEETRRPEETRQPEMPMAEKEPEEVAQPPATEVVVEASTPPVVREQTPEAPRNPPTARKDEPLLLAKSSYIQEGEENRKEAIRISKVLRAFRWNIEPAYVIGVVFDGNVSIESNMGVISGTLVKKIESLGYYLVAVNVNKERPIAWFKKGTPSLYTSSSESDRVRELRRRLEEQSRLLDEERRRFDQERAGWEERFQLLTKLIASRGQSEGPTEGAAPLSEIQPEPDLTG